MEKERWEYVIVDGMPTDYKISTYGRLYNVKNEAFVKDHSDGKYGYRRVSLSIDGKHRNFRIHRLVAKAFIPNPDNFPEIDHIDANPANNNVKNLRWTDRSGNVINSYKHGKKPSGVALLKGEDHLMAKTTEDKIHEVCRLLEQKVSCPVIAKTTGVSLGTIHSVKQGNTWTDISKDYNIEHRHNIDLDTVKIIIDLLVNGSYPTIAEMAEDLGVDKQKVLFIYNKRTYKDLTDLLLFHPKYNDNSELVLEAIVNSMENVPINECSYYNSLDNDMQRRAFKDVYTWASLKKKSAKKALKSKLAKVLL